MGNALSSTPLTAPPPPDIPNQPSGASSPLMAGPNIQTPSQQAQTPAPSPPPAPTHAQTVTALRHFGALEEELTGLMQDPDLGKTDMRSKVIDAMTELVAEGVVPAAGAVRDMGTFPEKPYDQRAWINQHFMNVVMAQTAILAHHQFGAMTGQDVQPDVEANSDEHQSVMAGLQSRYSGGQQ